MPRDLVYLFRSPKERTFREPPFNDENDSLAKDRDRDATPTGYGSPGSNPSGQVSHEDTDLKWSSRAVGVSP